MMFRSITLATTMSLLSAAVSTTAHAGENAAPGSDVGDTETPPGAVLATTPARRPEPEAGTVRVAGEVVAGLGVGVGLALGAGYVTYHAGQSDDDDGWDELGAFMGGTLIAGLVYPLGAGLGVGMVGNLGDVHGSYGAAIGGAYAGSLAGALLGWAFATGDAEGSAALLGYLAGAPLGAIIGHTMTLEYDEPGTGLLNISGNRARLGIPVVSVTADPLHPQSTLTNIRLMDGRF